MNTNNKLLTTLKNSVRSFNNKMLIKAIKIKQSLGFTNRVYNMFRPQVEEQYYRKGHILSNPTTKQIDAVHVAIIRKVRIDQWTIENNVDLYNDYEDSDNKWLQRPESIIDKIILYSTDSSSWSARDLYLFDRSTRNDITPGKELPGMSAHIFINSSGVVEKTSDYTNIITHTPANNITSLAIAMQYLMTNNSAPPTKKVLSSLERALTLLCLEFKLNPYKAIVGQRESRFTWIPFLKGRKKYLDKSPGDLISLDNIRREVAIKLQKKLNYYGNYKGPINGKFNLETRNALKDFNSNSINKLYQKLEIKKR